MARGTKKKKEPRIIPGTSDYVVRENAARKQLGVAGLAARNKQVPKAARAFTKEMTGIDISRKGVSVDPFGVAMALPLGKVIKAAKALSAAGKYERVAALESRIAAKLEGKFQTGNINDVRMRNQSTSVFPRIDSTKIRTAPNRILEMQGRKRAAEYTDMDKFNDYMSGYPTSRTPKAPKTPKKNSIFGKLGPNILRPTKGGR